MAKSVDEGGGRANEGAPASSVPNDASILAMLQDTAAAGFSCVDLEGRFVRVNSGLCRMLDYSEQEMLTMSFAEITHPDDKDLGPRAGFTAPSLAASTQVGADEIDRSSFEKRYVRRDGEVTWVLISTTLIYDDQNRPAYYSTLTLDISERKRAEQALQQSEERYRTYVGAAPDGVFVVDRAGRYVDVNEAACKMTGYTRDELLSFSIPDLVLPERREAAEERLRQIVAEGRTRHETKLRRKDGSQVAVVIDAVKLPGDRMMAYCKDVTERVNAERARLAMEERLQQAQSLESLGVLAGGIAHDFNNLLVGVLGNAEIVGLHVPPHAPAFAPLQDIVRAAERAAELCQQMLAYAGQASITMVDLDLSRSVDEMIGLLGTSIPRSASVHCDLPPNLPLIRADASQIRQVIMNLITNAAQAREQGALEINITTGVMRCDRDMLVSTYLADDLPEGRYVYLQVEDDGAGMDAKTQRRMFDPFFTTKPKGRGLGLAALLGIVRAHRGAIRVDSNLGSGTTVQIIFPEGAAGAPQTLDRAASDSVELQASGTVLLVDDEPLVRETMRSMLESFGFTVLAAADGGDALRQAVAHDGELRCVLLDFSMPDMNGDEVLRKLREIDADVPVIVLSGFSDHSMETTFVGLSVSAFVQKPFRMAELMTELRSALDGRGRQRN